ncbi:MAG: NAD(P)/FAD-dependent oxidoreductase [Oligoflexia bacterium]|nr:NAD(P)/FAD-dependent oxidoreductase [Oligoflexia bacterium]
MENKPSAIIVGAGYTGLSAAFDLVRQGYQVQIFESEDEIGGLAGTFELQPGYRVEKFYHHWFTSDTAILGLIRELGLGDRLLYKNSDTGLYFANSVFRLASPFDLLRFTPIPLIDRVRTGLMALKARRISDWRQLESQSAEEWIIRNGGRKAYEVIWKPLLAGKFGMEASNVSAVWFWNKLKLRGSSRDTKGAESLVYFEGGFGAVTAGLRQALDNAGVKFHLNTPVLKVLSQAGQVKGVRTASVDAAADQVVVTTPLPLALELAPELPESYTAAARQIRFLGNVCLVLRLNRSLSSTYWLNVGDPSFPFVGVIEHTNFDDPAKYGGERIAYISKYLPITDRLFSMSEREFFDYAVPFIRKIFPDFSESWVNGFKLWKAKYSQPVITRHYSQLIPDEATPIKGLWIANMAQIYPEDRGTNYAVRQGRALATRILSQGR